MNENVFSHDSIDLTKVLRMLLQKWYIIVCATVVAAAIGYIYSSFFITPLYRAKSTMLVDLRNSVHDDLSYEQVNIAANYVDTFAYVMGTNTVLEPVIETLDLDESVSSLASKLRIYGMEDTLLIRISIDYPDREIAKDIINVINKKAPEIINQKITSGYIIEVESPTVTSGPVSPNIPRYTLLGAMSGAAASLAFILLLFLLNNKIKSAGELQTLLELPLLGVIPTTQNVENQGKGA
ncbi:MAG: Wzz/FepE/Etk N-terminal domain-containing protein [Acutalibacteraceae bacterium]|nr:Wzz/FepE/Etk N-terminal domain-containing protein [Acutalibacteraceae bacterium]